MGRIPGKQMEIEITTRTDMSAPPAASPEGGHHCTDNKEQECPAYNRPEETQYDIAHQQPVEWLMGYL